MKRKPDAFTGQPQNARDRSRSLGAHAEAETTPSGEGAGGILSGITLFECFLGLMVLALLGVMFLSVLSEAQGAATTIMLEPAAG